MNKKGNPISHTTAKDSGNVSGKVAKDVEIEQSACDQPDSLECLLLLYLYDVKKVFNLKELAKVLNISHSRVTHVMDSLVKRKLVIRYPSVEDRRCWFAEITESGIKVAESLPQNVSSK